MRLLDKFEDHLCTISWVKLVFLGGDYSMALDADSTRGENSLGLAFADWTLGNSSAHFPFGVPQIFFETTSKIVPLARSHVPLDCR